MSYQQNGAAPSNEESFVNQYGEPNSNVQNIGYRNNQSNSDSNPIYNGANNVDHTIPIDTNI